MNTITDNMAYYQQIYSDNAQQRQDIYSSYANNYTTPLNAGCNCAITTIISAQPTVASQDASSIAATPTTKLGFFQKLKMKKKQKKQKKAAALSSVAATATGSIIASPTAVAKRKLTKEKGTKAKNGFKNFFKKLQIKVQKSSSTTAPVVTSTTADSVTSSAVASDATSTAASQ